VAGWLSGRLCELQATSLKELPMPRFRINLAGSEVFVPEFGKSVFDAKKAMCTEYSAFLAYRP
jgi:hypothetical protein